MQTTANLALRKPEGTDVVNVDDFNYNADIIDTEIVKKASSSVDGRMAKEDKAKLDGISTGANKVEQSTTNGNIKIDSVEKTVYLHPGSGTNPHGTTKTDIGLPNVTNDAQVKRTEMGAVSGVATLDTSGVNAQAPKTHTHTKSQITDFPTSLPASGGSADTAAKLATARTIALAGDVIGSTSFDGSANGSITVVLANSGATAGTFTKLTIDAKGRVTSATTLSASDIPALDWTKITSGKPTTLAGYGILDALLASSYTAADVLAKLKTVDGSGSGVDADTVDGKDSTAFALNNDYVHVPGYAVATGSANVYAVTLSPAPTAYIDGMCVVVKINVTSTGASTLNVNSLGAKTILDSLGNVITSGGLKVGLPYALRYNGTSFIVQGKGGGGNATAAGILLGETATVDSGPVTGTMPNNGAVTLTPTTSNVAISSGYHNGSGYVVGDADLISANIKAGASIFGVAGKSSVVETSDATATAAQILSSNTAYVNGSKITGTIPSKSAQTYTPGTGNQTIAASQYLSGIQTILGDANLIAANIINGKSIFGVAGTATIESLGGKMWASGSTYLNGTVLLQIAGLSFTPKFITTYSRFIPYGNNYYLGFNCLYTSGISHVNDLNLRNGSMLYTSGSGTPSGYFDTNVFTSVVEGGFEVDALKWAYSQDIPVYWFASE